MLASREHTCIQNIDYNYPYITYKSKTEMCKDLVDPQAVSVHNDNVYYYFSTYSCLYN